MTDEQGRLEVFVSFARDDAEHIEAVGGLCRVLRRRHGVGAIWDAYAANVPEWTEWIDEHMDKSDFIFVILSHEYKAHAERRGPQGKGLGVQYEMARMRNMLYSNFNKAIRKIIIVLLPGHTEDEKPTFLDLGALNYVEVENLTPEGIESVLRRIYDRPYETPEPLSPVPDLLTRAEEEAASAREFASAGPEEAEIAQEFTRALRTFEGRTEALENIAGWLADDDDRSSRIVVSGPGSGKTAMLGLIAHLGGGYASRVAIDLPDECRPPENSIQVTLYVRRNMVPQKILKRIAQAAGVPSDQIEGRISSASLEKGRKFLADYLWSNDIKLTVLLDALDEISPAETGRTIIA